MIFMGQPPVFFGNLEKKHNRWAKSQTKSTLLKIRIQASPDYRFWIIYIGDIYQETVFFAKQGLQNWKNGDIYKKLNKTAPH